MIASISFALLGLSHFAASHMVMKTPKPFSASKFAVNNGPLEADGSDYPCKFPYDPEGAMNEMPLGSTQKLSFTGHAVHGGGSCQVSIAYDPAPTSNTTFKVIHSIMGGCPSRTSPDNSGGPDEYDFKIPENLPGGNAILAWTWFNKVGNREMYMDCAPIKITGGSQKRDNEENKLLAERATASFESLPNMLVANVGNGCSTTEGVDVQFPNPGDSVEINSHDHLGPPVGNCGAVYGGSKIPSSSSSNQEPSKPQESSAVPGAFFTTPSSSDGQTSAENPQNEPASNEGASDGKPNDQSDNEKPHEPAPSSESGSNSTVPTDTKAGTACSSEGTWNCVGGNSFQQCASGTWSPVMPMAAGTSCKEGQSKTFHIEVVHTRSLRLPRSHLRRHQLGMNQS